MKTAIRRELVPLRQTHNSEAELEALEKEAMEALRHVRFVWGKLMRARITHDRPWVKILSSAKVAGVDTDAFRKKFAITPSTFSRWASGFCSPSGPLRTSLNDELINLSQNAEKHVDEHAVDM